MNNINYKELRSYKNLPKFDPGMTPISTGYQMGDNYVPIGQSQQGTQITSAFRSQIIPKMLNTALSVGTAAKELAAAYGSSIKAGESAAAAYGSAMGSSAKEAAAIGSKAATKAFSTAAVPLYALSAVKGGIDSIKTADEAGRSPLSSSDLLSSSGRSTDQVNGAGYERIDGYDQAGASKLLRDYNNANMTNSVTSGLEAGAGVGGLVGLIGGPAGSLLGSGIGAAIGSLAGAVTGWINRGKAKRKMHEIQHHFANNVEGYNRQNEAEAATKGLINQYYQSHYSADEGLDLFSGEPNAAIGGGETVVKTKKVNGKTKITDAETMPITPEHPWRLDNYPVKLDKGSGVAGNKYDPFTGVPYSLEAVFAAEKFNSNDPYAKAEGEQELLDIFDRQSKTPNNNPNPYEKMRKYNCGKGLRKMDYGGRDALKASHYLNIIPAALGMVEGYKELRDAEKMPTTALNSYVEAPSQMQAINSMPTVANINPLLREITDQDRYNDYAINQTGGLTKGQKMLMRSQAQANRLKAYADAYAKKWDLEQQLGATKANAWLNVSNNMATRAQQALREQIDNFMKAQGAKYNAKAMARKNMFTPLYAMAENWNNNNWQLAMMNLYEQNLSQKQKDSLRA